MILRFLLVFVFIAADIAAGVWVYHYANRQVTHKQQSEKTNALLFLCAQADGGKSTEADTFDPRLGQVYVENSQKGKPDCPAAHVAGMRKSSGKKSDKR